MGHQLGAILIGMSMAVSALGAGAENLALHRPYTFNTAPNYGFSTDPGDAVQLTDGEISKASNAQFWVQKGTVGWQYAGAVSITIDLGRADPIGGIDFNSAGGSSEVGFPSFIHLWTSEDGKSWRFGGEVIASSWKKGLPDSRNNPTAYRGEPMGTRSDGSFTYQARDLKLHGRYIKLTALSAGLFLFCDEIRVWKGNFNFDPKSVLPGAIERTDKFEEWTMANKWTDIARVRMLYDLQELGRDKQAGKFAAEIDGLRREVLTMDRLKTLDMSKGLPYTDLHARIWALNGKLQKEGGSKIFVLRPASRYSPLHPFDVPGKDRGSVTVHMIGNEYRNAAVNLSNFSDRPVKATVTLAWKDQKASAAWAKDNVIVRQVWFTESQMRFISDKPLPKIDPVGENTWTVDLPAGATGQVWLTFHAAGVSRGEYSGLFTAAVSGEKESLSLPITVRVHAGALPAMPTLETYPWDYLSLPNGNRAVTPTNRPLAVKTMREYLINSHWINRWDLPRGETRPDGSFGINPEQFKSLDDWLAAVSPARRYFLFLCAEPEADHVYTGGHRRGTPEYARAITGYFTALADHLKAKKYDLRQFAIEVIDEPSGQPVDIAAAEFIRIAKSAVPEFKFFEDPMITTITPALKDASDLISPKIADFEGNKPLAEYYDALRRDKTKQLMGYNCSQNSLWLRTNGYYRRTAWLAWHHGMTGIGLWDFMVHDKPDTWDNFTTGTYDGMVFVAADSITPGKQLEAWREGIEDYEYFYILKSLLAQGEKEKLPAAMLSRAKFLTEKSAEKTWTEVLNSNPRGWAADDPYDQTRLELLTAIDNLWDRLYKQ